MHMFIHACVYPYIYTCRHIHICMFINTHIYTHTRTHIQHAHMHTRKHAWNDSAAATARGTDADARNARTSLYPLSETPIPLKPPSPLPNIPQNSSRTTASAVLLLHTDQHNRVHHSEEVPCSFTMAPCIVVERFEGKQRCSRALSRQARRTPSPRMSKVTVHEKRMVNKKQPNPAAAHHTITTARRPDNTRLSALVRSRSTQFMARPSR